MSCPSPNLIARLCSPIRDDLFLRELGLGSGSEIRLVDLIRINLNQPYYSSWVSDY